MVSHERAIYAVRDVNIRQLTMATRVNET